jgi:Flp pilus assembly pilin Flp
MWTDLMVWLTSRVALRDEKGQTAVEYALVIGLVALVLVAALATGGTGLFTAFWAKVSTAMGV